MNLEPQKFFIGIVDFFSILMPGAMLAYLARDWAGPYLFGTSRAHPVTVHGPAGLSVGMG